jgi:heterodisulfide reductase subunit B
MDYLYYPGCSLTASAREYDLATRAVMTAAGAALEEITGWTCCGASAAAPISHLLSLSLSARNLALAEKMILSENTAAEQVLVPCSACYLNLKRARETLRSSAGERAAINQALSAVDLEARGEPPVRHLLDVLAHDVGVDRLRPLMTNPLAGLTVAPYYGCQCLRPYAAFDDPERPVSMEPLIRLTGAAVHDWDMGARCCGAALVNTEPTVGLERVAAILQAARGADLIVTVCPMCQINLDGWQARAARTCGQPLAVTVLYLPQLLGLAMGIDPHALGLDLNLVVQKGVDEHLRRARSGARRPIA